MSVMIRRGSTGGDAGDGEDRALIARVASGDRIALELLYRRHAGWLTSRLQSRCGDADLTDIAVQDTFLALWRSPKSFRGEGDVGAWLWGIGIRKLIDQLRKHRASPVDPALIGVDDRSLPSPDVADELFAGGGYGDLGPSLGRLAPDLRAVLIATAIDGLSTKEAALLLGVPQGTVKTRLMRARHAMQEALS
jgi:RNA polymerase sigma-70 factor, ECF subfamily